MTDTIASTEAETFTEPITNKTLHVLIEEDKIEEDLDIISTKNNYCR